MYNNYKSRKEKVEILTDILQGRKTVADIDRNGKVEIRVWRQDDTGNWLSDKGHSLTDEEMQSGFTYSPSHLPNVIDVVVIPPVEHDDY